MTIVIPVDASEPTRPRAAAHIPQDIGEPPPAIPLDFGHVEDAHAARLAVEDAGAAMEGDRFE